MLRRAVLCLALGGLGVLGCDAPGDDVGARADALSVTQTGSVTDSTGAPIENVTLEFRQAGSTVASTISGPDGSWSLTLLDGVYDIYVDPPPESVYVPQTLVGQTIDGAAPLQIVLVSGGTYRYTATVEDRDGAPVANAQVCLFPEGPGTHSCLQTDAAGAAELSMAAGSYRVEVNAFDDEMSPSDLPSHVQVQFPSVTLTGDLAETLTIPNTRVDLTVVDADGAVVAGAYVSLDVWDWDEVTETHRSSNDWGTTDAAGQVTVWGLPGDAQLRVTPQGGTAPPKTETFTIAGDEARTVTLEAPAVYTATVEDRDGTAVANAQVCLFPEGPGTHRCEPSDASGVAVLSMAPGSYRVEVNAFSDEMAPSSLPQHVQVQFPSIALTADLGETLTIPNRRLDVTVLDAGGVPVANAHVSLDVWEWDEVTETHRSSNDWGTTDAAGQVEMWGIPGDAQLRVTPQGGTAPPTTETFTIVGDAPRTVTLVTPAVYTATVQDRDGTAVPNAQVCLFPEGPGTHRCEQSDALGIAVLSMAPGSYRVEVNAFSDEMSPSSLPSHLQVQFPSVALTVALAQTLTLPNRVIAGRVVDADGVGVANAHVSLDVWHWDEVTETHRSSNDWAVTQADGRFTLGAVPGTGQLRVQPAEGSGLEPFTLGAYEVVGDATLAILVQFLSEDVSVTVPPGGTAGTDGEGDGATPEDPVETSVTSPTGGDVIIDEQAIQEPPPVGYTFLTQQVSITAPPSTPEDPLVLTFTIDSSRVPAGEDETTLQVFRNGVVVPDCLGSPIADPDPCITTRTTVGDDVVLTALTSAASVWNIGIVGSLPIDTDGDGVLDEHDSCPNEPEDLDGYQDEDGCPDLDDDGDGIPDDVDACRLTPEDLDGYEDEDGCPEDGPEPPPFCPDFDGDGLITVRDQVQLTRAMGSSEGGRRYRDDVDLDDDGDVDVVDLHLFMPYRDTACGGEPPPCDPEADPDCGGPPPDCDPADPMGGCYDPCAAGDPACDDPCATDPASCEPPPDCDPMDPMGGCYDACAADPAACCPAGDEACLCEHDPACDPAAVP